MYLLPYFVYYHMLIVPLHNYRYKTWTENNRWIKPISGKGRIVCLHTGWRWGQNVLLPDFWQRFKKKKRGLWFGAVPEEFPADRECLTTRTRGNAWKRKKRLVVHMHMASFHSSRTSSTWRSFFKKCQPTCIVIYMELNKQTNKKGSV